MTPALPIQTPLESPSVGHDNRAPKATDDDRAASDFKPALKEARRDLAGRDDRSRRVADDRTPSRRERSSGQPDGLRNRGSRRTADRKPAVATDRSQNPGGENRTDADQRITNQTTEDGKAPADETATSTAELAAESALGLGQTDPSDSLATITDAVMIDGPENAETTNAASSQPEAAVGPEPEQTVDEQAAEGLGPSAEAGGPQVAGPTNASLIDLSPQNTGGASKPVGDSAAGGETTSGSLTTDAATEDRTVDLGPPRSIAPDDGDGQTLQRRVGTKGGPDRPVADREAGRTDLDLSIVDPEPGTAPDPLGPQISGLTPGTSRQWAAQSAATQTGPEPAQTVGDMATGGDGDVAPAELPGVVATPVETTPGAAISETVTTTSKAESAAPNGLSSPTNPALTEGLTEEAATELWGQVQRALARARTGGSGQEVRIRLRPAELGELLVQVSTQGDQLNVRLVTSSAAAQQTLIDDQQRLAAELAQAGFADGMVDISHQGSRQRPDSGSDEAPAGTENTVGDNGVLHARRRSLTPGITFGERRDASINLTL